MINNTKLIKLGMILIFLVGFGVPLAYADVITYTEWGLSAGAARFNRPYGTAVDSSGNVYVVDVSNSRVQKFSSTGVYITQWGSYGSGDGQLSNPQGIAIDSGGNVYVVDNGNYRVQKFSGTGVYITQWGSNGSGNGQFYQPYGIAVDSSSNVYVGDVSSNRVQKFNSTGTYLTKWGTQGTGTTNFDNPRGIAVDSSSYIYVTDANNSRILKFNNNGVYQAQWGTQGSGNGQFIIPYGIAIDSGYSIYVADTGNNRIQKFNSGRTYLTQWGTGGTGNGQFNSPQGLVVDSSSNVYVTDSNSSGNNRIQKFDSSGTYSTQWGTYGSTTGDNGQFNYPNGITVDSSGNVYVVDTNSNRIQKFNNSGTYLTKLGSSASFSSPNGAVIDSSSNVYISDTGNNRIQKLFNNGIQLIQWGTSGSGTSQFNAPNGIARDSSGNIYVADSGNNRIQKFGSGGNYLTQWGTGGTGNSQFYVPIGIAIDSSGNVYVVDRNNNRIQKFSGTGTYITQWGTSGSGNSQFNTPNGIAVDSSGNIYVADRNNNRVQKFSGTGTYITQWGTSGSGNGQFSYTSGIAVDTGGNVFVIDQNNNRIQKFSSIGTFITKWGGITPGSGNGQFYTPAGITVDTGGNVYVVDQNNNRIQKLDSTGTYSTKWGTYGTGDGQFSLPNGVTVDSGGNILVVDTGNNRIQKFTSTGTYSTKWGTAGTGNSQFNAPNGIAVDSIGNVYVADRNNNRIQKFSDTGTYITQWGTNGTGDGQLKYPNGITIDSGDNVYVAEQNNNRVQKFSSTGTYLSKWGGTALGTGNGQFSAPNGIKVDSLGNIYVADSANHRIAKIEIISVPQISNIAPSRGPLTAGQSIAVTGSGFRSGDTTITIGGSGNSCTNLTVSLPTSLTCNVPAGAAGGQNVVITTSGGTSTVLGGYTYVAPPAAPSGLSLNTPTTSPNYITTPIIAVAGVVSGDTVKLFSNSGCTTQKGSATAAGTSVNITSSALTAGSYTFYANSTDNVGNISTCSTNNVVYVVDLTAPTVVSSTPNWATAAGGSITVAGDHFYSVSAVTVADNPCTGVNITSPTSLNCTAPVSNLILDGDMEAANSVANLADGNMESASSTSWAAYNATLSKGMDLPHGGTQYLKVTGTGSTPFASQTILNSNKTYTVSGWAKGDGTYAPIVYVGTATINWTGTSSTNWQAFTITVKASNTLLGLGAGNAAGIVGFDDITITDVTAGSWYSYHATLSKQTTNPHSGSQLLRVAYLDSGNCKAFKVITINKNYRITGWARSDGTSIPIIADNYRNIWTGTASTSWQYIDVLFTTIDENIHFRNSSTATAGHYVEFDDVRVEPLYDTTANIAVTTPVGTGTGTGVFTYYAMPAITTIAPINGTTAGNTTITISGTNFRSGAAVSVGGSGATGVNFINAGTLSAITHSGSAGPANVVVTNPGPDSQTGTLIGGYTYIDPPAITGISPSTGYPAGGDTITITGTNFQQTGITVNFDTGPSIAAAQSVIRNSAEQLTVVTPAHAVGTVAVTVTNIDGQYAVAATGFTFANLSFTKLGDDSADYVLPSDGNGAYAAELNFNVGLTAGQKTIIENAVTAGADHTTAYLWSSGNKKLTISATVPTTFNNDVIATIAAVNLLLIDSKLETAQVTATTNTSVTTSTPQVVVETLAPITVTVPSNTTNATLNVDSLTTGNTGTLPEITVNATTAGGSYQIAIPASTTVTAGAAWNSVIELPTEKAVNTVTVTPTEGKTTTVSTVISIGSETVSLSFNKGVRLKFTNARNKLVGFYRNSTFAPITTTCTLNSVPTDSQAAGDQLAPDGDCKINSGTDLIVWTKHFTDFIIYDEMGALTVTDVNSDLGSINGQQHVVITGTNFGTGAIASFDGTDAPSTYVLNGTTILAVTPTGSVGPVDVAVRNLTGTPAILTYGYTYDIDSHLDIPAVDTIVPITGSTLGGTPTTITGSGFLAGATAYFGQNSAQTTTISNSTTILAATRSHAAGAVDVIVVNLDGTWGIGTDLFTYETPAGAAICGPGTSQQCATQEITCYEGSLSFGRTPNSITFDSQVASGNIKQSYDSAINDGLVLTNTNVLSVIDTRSGNTTNCPLSLKGFIVQAEATQLNNNNGTSPPISNTNLRVITSNELNPINPICERADGLEACYGAAEGTGNLRDITAPVLYDDFARLLADQYLKFNQPDPYLYKAEDGNLVTNVSDTYPQGDAPSPTPLLNILSGPVDLLTTNTSHNQTIYTGVAVKAEIPAGQDPGTYTGTITYTLAAQ